jgi:hypothetical protein
MIAAHTQFQRLIGHQKNDSTKYVHPPYPREDQYNGRQVTGTRQVKPA